MDTQNHAYAPKQLIGAGFALTISLAWNEAIKHLFEKSAPGLKKYGPFGYAIAVTILGIIVISLLFRNERKVVVQEKKEQLQKKRTNS